ncbi:hypothetical protein AB6Q13_04320 [Ralstonia solanacearum]|uniref:Uncharacterized protein n=1 Tax=Ralstonia solanacearum TaxID=305 RepID=A0AAW5ZW55_RALSL|nr:hypothetical protein [Ralstonia solanacearum]MDB0509867.1 hypothetical protein [Ralstonia solanacearum]MDB0567372.1 hypothetical protein [Ralstonia solanacearum]MDB0574011.1 hypothetical protein [Ralstonia solanacearum]MDB0577625.1 hypothetical protein [Ralstonia solanacearum]OAI60382.1 hypothetical protein RSP795_17830 [Ralstonia solanacearum]
MDEYAEKVVRWLAPRLGAAEQSDPVLAMLKQRVRDATGKLDVVHTDDDAGRIAALEVQNDAIAKLVRYIC